MRWWIKSIDFLDNMVNCALLCLCLLIGCYALYALYDTWYILNSAGNKDLLKYKPTYDAAGSVSFETLQALNPEVVAWLTIEDTSIDYPVCQGEDNIKYVNTDALGNYALSGALFLDSRNAGDFSDDYQLIYGHHMQTHAMFGELDSFLDPHFFERHLKGTLYLSGDQVFDITWFACVSTDIYDTMIYTQPFVDQDTWDAEDEAVLYEYLYTSAVCHKEIEQTKRGSVIGLSTCSDADTNARILLFGMIAERR